MVDGLWEVPMATLVRFVASHGFNALRIPLSVDVVQRNPRISVDMVRNDPALLARNAPALLPYSSHFDVAHGASDISVERMGASGLFEGHSSGGLEMSASKPEAISYTKRKTSTVI